MKIFLKQITFSARETKTSRFGSKSGDGAGCGNKPYRNLCMRYGDALVDLVLHCGT